jgi:hypothetical protein
MIADVAADPSNLHPCNFNVIGMLSVGTSATRSAP